MQSTLLSRATKVVNDQHLLVNIIRLRVRQLMRGHRPLIAAPPGMGLADIALSEIIAGTLSFEVAPGVLPDNSFMPVLRFPTGGVEKKAA
jgi:DNA-directed RNA polymerase subunit K/omega